MDTLDLEDLLDAMETIGTPPKRGRGKSKPVNTANMSTDDAWTMIRAIAAKYGQTMFDTPAIPGRPHQTSTPAAAMPSSDLAPDPGSTSLFPSNQPPARDDAVPEPSGEPIERTDAKARRCLAHTRSGKPCRTYARSNSDYCFAHDDASRDDFIATSSAAGAASGEARRKLPFDIASISLTNMLGLQVALDAVFRLELTGQLPPSRSRTLVRILAIVARSVDREQPVDPDSFDRSVKALNEELGEAVEAQHRADRRRATNDVENETMRRGQLAVDLERWPALDQRPASARKLDHGITGSFRSARDHPDFRA